MLPIFCNIFLLSLVVDVSGYPSGMGVLSSSLSEADTSEAIHGSQGVGFQEKNFIRARLKRSSFVPMIPRESYSRPTSFEIQQEKKAEESKRSYQKAYKNDGSHSKKNKYYASGKKYNSGRNKKSSNKDFNKHIKHNKGHEVFDKKHSNKGKKKTGKKEEFKKHDNDRKKKFYDVSDHHEYHIEYDYLDEYFEVHDEGEHEGHKKKLLKKHDEHQEKGHVGKGEKLEHESGNKKHHDSEERKETKQKYKEGQKEAHSNKEDHLGHHDKGAHSIQNPIKVIKPSATKTVPNQKHSVNVKIQPKLRLSAKISDSLQVAQTKKGEMEPVDEPKSIPKPVLLDVHNRNSEIESNTIKNYPPFSKKSQDSLKLRHYLRPEILKSSSKLGFIYINKPGISKETSESMTLPILTLPNLTKNHIKIDGTKPRPTKVLRTSQSIAPANITSFGNVSLDPKENNVGDQSSTHVTVHLEPSEEDLLKYLLGPNEGGFGKRIVPLAKSNKLLETVKRADDNNYQYFKIGEGATLDSIQKDVGREKSQNTNKEEEETNSLQNIQPTIVEKSTEPLKTYHKEILLEENYKEEVPKNKENPVVEQTFVMKSTTKGRDSSSVNVEQYHSEEKEPVFEELDGTDVVSPGKANTQSTVTKPHPIDIVVQPLLKTPEKISAKLVASSENLPEKPPSSTTVQKELLATGSEEPAEKVEKNVVSARVDNPGDLASAEGPLQATAKVQSVPLQKDKSQQVSLIIDKTLEPASTSGHGDHGKKKHKSLLKEKKVHKQKGSKKGAASKKSEGFEKNHHENHSGKEYKKHKDVGGLKHKEKKYKETYKGHHVKGKKGRKGYKKGRNSSIRKGHKDHGFEHHRNKVVYSKKQDFYSDSGELKNSKKYDDFDALFDQHMESYEHSDEFLDDEHHHGYSNHKKHHSDDHHHAKGSHSRSQKLKGGQEKGHSSSSNHKNSFNSLFDGIKKQFGDNFHGSLNHHHTLANHPVDFSF